MAAASPGHRSRSALVAVQKIIDQGEGALGDWETAHYGRFLSIRREFDAMLRADPTFKPARPALAAFLRQPFDIPTAQPLITDAQARQIAKLAGLTYELMLGMLLRFFTHTDVVAGRSVGSLTDRLSKSGRRRRHRVEPPGSRHALQVVFSLVIEHEVSAHHVASHRVAHQHLSRPAQIAYPFGDGHGQTGNVIAAHLDLTGVRSRPQVQPDVLGESDNLGGAAQRSPGGVEGGHEAVSVVFTSRPR